MSSATLKMQGSLGTGERCAILTDLQYQLFVSLLKTKQMPSTQLLRAADLLNQPSEIIAAERDSTDPQDKTDQSKESHKGRIRNATTRGLARFRAWASRMRLDEHNRLVFKRTGKIILPKRKFASKIREIHQNNGAEKHLSFPKTYARIQEMYTVGKRQFGMSEDLVRQVVRKCSCNIHVKDDIKQDSNDKSTTEESDRSPSNIASSASSGSQTVPSNDSNTVVTETLPSNIQTITANQIITPTDQLQKLPKTMCVVKVQPGGGIQLMYQPQNSNKFATFKLTVPQTTSSNIVIPGSGLQFISAVNSEAQVGQNGSSFIQPILQWCVKPSIPSASLISGDASGVKENLTKNDSPTLKSMLTTTSNALTYTTMNNIQSKGSLLNSTATFPCYTITTASVANNNKRTFSDLSDDLSNDENKTGLADESSIRHSKRIGYIMKNVVGKYDATETPGTENPCCNNSSQQAELETEVKGDKMPSKTSLLTVREVVPSNIAWNFPKDDVENETNIYSRALAVLKDAKMDVKKAIANNKQACERLRKKLLYSEDLFRLCKHRVFMEAVKTAAKGPIKKSTGSVCQDSEVKAQT